jgi:hypothetical protein
MDAKTAFFDNDVRPSLRNQFAFGDNLAGPVDEGHQDVKGPPTQRNDFVRFLEIAFRDVQLK